MYAAEASRCCESQQQVLSSVHKSKDGTEEAGARVCRLFDAYLKLEAHRWLSV